METNDQHHRDTVTSIDGNLHVYELTHPTDHTKNGQVKFFRDTDPREADLRASAVARREGCGLRRKAIF